MNKGLDRKLYTSCICWIYEKWGTIKHVPHWGTLWGTISNCKGLPCVKNPPRLFVLSAWGNSSWRMWWSGLDPGHPLFTPSDLISCRNHSNFEMRYHVYLDPMAHFLKFSYQMFDEISLSFLIKWCAVLCANKYNRAFGIKKSLPQHRYIWSHLWKKLYSYHSYTLLL